jgi:vacuolar-type H+-ATPase subunit I/STV1
MPWLSSLGDADKTVAANAALQKKAENQAKWEQWGNLFMHLGNFFGTVQGAPSQKIESAQELTDRQRKIREATEALRAKGYNQMMVNIYKDRQDKQAQMQAEAAAKANEALAAYRGSQKAQEDALTPVKVKTEQERGNAAAAAAALNTSKKKTEDALRGKKGKLLDAQTRHINSQTEGQNQRNANQKEADDLKFDRTPPSRRGRGGSKVPPSRRGGSKVPPSRRRK